MLGQGDPDEALVALYRQNVVECLDYYDRFLSTQDFLGGKVGYPDIPSMKLTRQIGLFSD